MADDPILGGFVISRPAPIVVHNGDTQGFTLISDVHIGAPQVDLKLLSRELETALEYGDRILINGDLLDLVVTKDHKRFSGDCIHPRLQGRKDIVNEAIEWAVEILSPYAHLIDMIGLGNHETKIEKFSSVDPTKIIVYELARLAKERNKDHVLHYGGYTGYVSYSFLRDGGRRDKRGCLSSRRWVLFYHHGSGGAAPVTKGMIDFQRKDVWVDADMIWLGHKHNCWNAKVQKISCPRIGNDLDVRDVRHVMTGAYCDTYVAQSQASIKRHGRRSNYAADWGVAPQGKGGARVLLQFSNERANYEVKVLQ